MWLLQQNELSNCNGIKSQCDNRGTMTSWRNFWAGTTVVTGAAALTMAAIGIVDWLGPTPQPTNRSSVACSVFHAGLVCGSAF
jgi:hypothetical protein